MARQPVAELWVQTQGVALVPRTAAVPARDAVGVGGPAGSDLLQAWVDRTSASPRALVLGGLALAGTGLVLGSVVMGGLLSAVVFGGMLTMGGGMTLLGVLKHRRRTSGRAAGPQPPAALPPAGTSPQVRAERCRRLGAVIAERGPSTFEQLVGSLRWTESALLEALVEMKESGLVEEDLDLESGEWIYRPGELLGAPGPAGTPGSLTLADRQARAGLETR